MPLGKELLTSCTICRIVIHASIFLQIFLAKVVSYSLIYSLIIRWYIVSSSLECTLSLVDSLFEGQIILFVIEMFCDWPIFLCFVSNLKFLLLNECVLALIYSPTLCQRITGNLISWTCSALELISCYMFDKITSFSCMLNYYVTS